MGLIEKLFPKAAVSRSTSGFFKTLNAYQPMFTSFNAGLYEAELCRSAIHTFATHCSKLMPEAQGPGAKRLNAILQYQPNPYMDTTKFLYKLATILETDTTAFITPIMDRDMLVGFYPIKPSMATIRELNGVPYITYNFQTGDEVTLELSSVGIVNKFFYSSEFFGEGNAALNTTLQLINTQNTGITEAIKKSATVRFLAQMAGSFKAAEMDEARKGFTQDNLSAENNGGVMVYDEKFIEVKAIDSRPYFVPEGQAKMIRENVNNYFGTSMEIIQNTWTDEQINAYYEGKVEPFAMQVGLVLTNMIYNQAQKANGNKVVVTANRLDYLNPNTKLSIVTQLFDRGMMTRNTGLGIFQMPKVDDGDDYFIRGEYINTKKNEEPPTDPPPKDPPTVPAEPGDGGNE